MKKQLLALLVLLSGVQADAMLGRVLTKKKVKRCRNVGLPTFSMSGESGALEDAVRFYGVKKKNKNRNDIHFIGDNEDEKVLKEKSKKSAIRFVEEENKQISFWNLCKKIVLMQQNRIGNSFGTLKEAKNTINTIKRFFTRDKLYLFQKNTDLQKHTDRRYLKSFTRNAVTSTPLAVTISSSLIQAAQMNSICAALFLFTCATSYEAGTNTINLHDDDKWDYLLHAIASLALYGFLSLVMTDFHEDFLFLSSEAMAGLSVCSATILPYAVGRINRQKELKKAYKSRLSGTGLNNEFIRDLLCVSSNKSLFYFTEKSNSKLFNEAINKIINFLDRSSDENVANLSQFAVNELSDFVKNNTGSDVRTGFFYEKYLFVEGRGELHRTIVPPILIYALLQRAMFNNQKFNYDLSYNLLSEKISEVYYSSDNMKQIEENLLTYIKKTYH